MEKLHARLAISFFAIVTAKIIVFHLMEVHRRMLVIIGVQVSPQHLTRLVWPAALSSHSSFGSEKQLFNLLFNGKGEILAFPILILIQLESWFATLYINLFSIKFI